MARPPVRLSPAFHEASISAQVSVVGTHGSVCPPSDCPVGDCAAVGGPATHPVPAHKPVPQANGLARSISSNAPFCSSQACYPRAATGQRRPQSPPGEVVLERCAALHGRRGIGGGRGGVELNPGTPRSCSPPSPSEPWPPRDERPVESGDELWKKLYDAFIASPIGIASARCGQHASRGRALGGGMRALAPPEGRPQQLPLYLNVTYVCPYLIMARRRPNRGPVL
jgi:hypothetical protein